MKANQFARNNGGYTGLVPLVLAVIITFAILFIGAYINGTIQDSLEDTYPAPGSRTPLQNQSVNAMNNISQNWDSSLDIVQVTIIISVLATAVGAIFLFTRFGG